MAGVICTCGAGFFLPHDLRCPVRLAGEDAGAADMSLGGAGGEGGEGEGGEGEGGEGEGGWVGLDMSVEGAEGPYAELADDLNEVLADAVEADAVEADAAEAGAGRGGAAPGAGGALAR